MVRLYYGAVIFQSCAIVMQMQCTLQRLNYNGDWSPLFVLLLSTTNFAKTSDAVEPLAGPSRPTRCCLFSEVKFDVNVKRSHVNEYTGTLYIGMTAFLSLKITTIANKILLLSIGLLSVISWLVHAQLKLIIYLRILLLWRTLIFHLIILFAISLLLL